MRSREKMTTSTRTMLATIAFALSAAVVVAVPVADGEVTGTAPASSRGFASVVILEDGPAGDAPVPEEPVRMDQVDQTFVPGVVVVRLGQKMIFENSDDLLHNVHIYDFQDDSSLLNVGMPPVIKEFPHQFEKPGVYAVLCDVHPQMEAYVIVTESPFYAIAGEDGGFDLSGVPAGQYTARIWNVEESRQFTRSVSVDSPSTSLDLSRR